MVFTQPGLVAITLANCLFDPSDYENVHGVACGKKCWRYAVCTGIGDYLYAAENRNRK